MLSTGEPILDISQDDMESVTKDYDKKPYATSASKSEKLDQSMGRFTCFTKLPAEMRLKIWKFALPGPRVMRIDIRYGARPPVKMGEKKERRPLWFVASHRPPVGLRVCHESRIEALKEYELAFPTKTSPAQTYVNFALDTLVLDRLFAYFPHIYSVASSSKIKKPVILHREFSKIRHLVIEETMLWNGRLLPSRNFPNLTSIYIIAHTGTEPFFAPSSCHLVECERPGILPQSPQLVGLVQTWLDQMKLLAKGADPRHPPPVIRFVRPVIGSVASEVKLMVPEAVVPANGG